MKHPGTPSFSDENDLLFIGRSIIRKFPRHLLLSIILGILVYLALTWVTPRYSSAVKLVIGEYDNAFVQPVTINQTSLGLTISDDLIKSQIEILQSSEIILAAMSKLEPGQASSGIVKIDGQTTNSHELAHDPRRLDENYSKLYRKFRKNISVQRLNRCRVIAIEVSHKDNVYAGRAANAIAEAYVEWQRRTYTTKNQKASRWLGEEITKLRKRVGEAENDIAAFREQIDLQDTGPDRTLNIETLTDVNRQLIESRAKKRETETRVELLKKLAKGENGLVLAPDILNTTLIQNLTNQRVQLRRRISELSATHLSGHPRIKQLQWDLKSINTQIRSEANKILKSLENEAQLAKVREQSLLASLHRLKKQSAESSQNQVKLRALEREAKASRDLLESYMSRYREANTRHYDGSIPSDITIIEWAKVEDLPYFPKKILTSSVSMIATLLLLIVFSASNQLLPASFDDSGSRSNRFSCSVGAPDDRMAAPVNHQFCSHDLRPNNNGKVNPSDNRTIFQRSSGILGDHENTIISADRKTTNTNEGAAAERSETWYQPAVAQNYSGKNEETDYHSSRPKLEPTVSDRQVFVKKDISSAERSKDRYTRSLSIVEAVQNIYPVVRVLNGYRLLFTGLNNSVDILGGVLQAAQAISAMGGSVILVDIGQSEFTLTDHYGFDCSRGVCEVMRGEANIEDVIKSAELEKFHFITAGLRKNSTGEDLFSNRLLRLFAELDPIYDVVVIYGETDSARRFIAAIDSSVQSCICIIPDYCREEQLIPGRLTENFGISDSGVEIWPVRLV